MIRIFLVALRKHTYLNKVFCVHESEYENKFYTRETDVRFFGRRDQKSDYN